MTSLVGCAGVVAILMALDVRPALAAFIVLAVLAGIIVWFQRAPQRL